MMTKTVLLIMAFPTHVGVILSSRTHTARRYSFPHTCGGDPKALLGRHMDAELSPHMWG